MWNLSSQCRRIQYKKQHFVKIINIKFFGEIMSLQFILGRAGAGKSTLLYKKLIETSIKNSDKRIVAVVPEQYSMETQKQILTMINNEYGRSGSFNIEVTSLTRLAYSVLEEQGVANYKVMDELGKTLIVRKILEDLKNDLTIYKGKTSMPGFADKVKSVISEFKQYGITDEVLDDMLKLSDKKPGLKHKLKDIQMICRAFDDYIRDKMITTEDVLTLFCRYIADSNLIKDTYLYFDSFTGFTPVQYQVLELLMRYSKGVTLTVTLPEDEKNITNYNKFELFSLSKETIAKVSLLAEKNNINIKKNLIAGENKRPYRIKDNDNLCYLENNIFRNKIIKKSDNPCRSVEVFAASNPHSEVKTVVSKIADLVINKGYRYNDIAIITGDMENYHRYIEEELLRYDIPAFIDHKRDISSNPFVDAVSAVLDVILKDFSYDAIMHMLRLSFMDIDREDADIFENYIRRFGRRGFKSYSRDWEKTYKEFSEEKMERVNAVRISIYDNIVPLRDVLKNKNSSVADYTTAVYSFVQNRNIQEKIEHYAEKFKKDGNLSLSKEYEQAYEVIISMFERIVNLMGDEYISLREYSEILKAGFQAVKVGIIPPGLDTVMVGDIERTRLKDTKKIIFFVGVNDTVIPNASSGGGIITDADRDFFRSDSQNKEICLAPTARDNIFKQRVYLYSLFAKPSKKLCLSFSKTDASGKAMRKSYIIGALQKIFADLKIIEEEAIQKSIDDITTKKAALEYLASNISEYRYKKSDVLFEALLSVMAKDKNNSGFVSLIKKGAFYKSKNPYLDEEVARRLYSDKENMGITRLEKFAACAYFQFLKNGLKLGERKEFEIAAYDIGNLYHDIIQHFFEDIQKRNIKWEYLEKSTSDVILEECVIEAMENYDNEALDGTARNLFIKNQVRETAKKTVDVLIRHIKSGSFKPSEYELRVTHGRIDRVDVYESGEDIFVKVIDYKSGNTEFNVTDTFFGMQMQLMVYLRDAINFEKKKHPDKNVLPGAGLYFHIQNPYINRPDIKKAKKDFIKENSKETLSDDEIILRTIENEQYKCFRMSGLVNSDFSVIESIDNELSDKTGASKIVKVSTTKKGVDKRSTVIDSSNYMKFIDHVADMADEMKKDIIKGNIKINPIEKACDYCPYGGICGFDRKLGDRYREMEKVGLEDVIARLNGSDEVE